MNYGWLDPSGRGYAGNHADAPRLSRHGTLLWSVQIWEIFTEMENCGERVKNLLVEFFLTYWISGNISSRRLEQKIIVDRPGCCRQRILVYADIKSGAIQYVNSHWGIVDSCGSVYRQPPWLSTSDQSRVGFMQFVNMPFFAVDNHMFLTIF